LILKLGLLAVLFLIVAGLLLWQPKLATRPAVPMMGAR
jgi:hypothetical protein